MAKPFIIDYENLHIYFKSYKSKSRDTKFSKRFPKQFEAQSPQVRPISTKSRPRLSTNDKLLTMKSFQGRSQKLIEIKPPKSRSRGTKIEVWRALGRLLDAS